MKCYWEYYKDREQPWHTTCGETFKETSPHWFNYCPFCGRKMGHVNWNPAISVTRDTEESDG